MRSTRRPLRRGRRGLRRLDARRVPPLLRRRHAARVRLHLLLSSSEAGEAAPDAASPSGPKRCDSDRSKLSPSSTVVALVPGRELADRRLAVRVGRRPELVLDGRRGRLRSAPARAPARRRAGAPGEFAGGGGASRAAEAPSFARGAARRRYPSHAAWLIRVSTVQKHCQPGAAEMALRERCSS